MKNVFSVPIEGLDWNGCLARIDAEKLNPLPFWIVTTNPEILLFARQNATYLQTLQQADLRLVDGFGLWIVQRLFRQPAHRLTGVDLAEHLLNLAEQRHWRVGFFGGDPDIAERAKKFWLKQQPTLHIHVEDGGRIQATGDGDVAEEEARGRMMQFAPEILLVALGHPKQELWILKHRLDFPTTKVIVGVGGTFDFWAGKVPRAPRWMQICGIEWLFRLWQEPRRVVRIFRAVVLFPFFVAKDAVLL